MTKHTIQIIGKIEDVKISSVLTEIGQAVDNILERGDDIDEVELFFNEKGTQVPMDKATVSVRIKL